MNNNMNKDDSIKKENKKALKVFIPVIICAGLIGGIFGWFSTDIVEHGGAQDLADALEQCIHVVAPYLLMALEVVLVAVGYIGYKKGKSLFAGYETADDDDEAERIYEQADKYLSKVLGFMGAAIILCFMFFAIIMIDIRPNIEERSGLLLLAMFVTVGGGFGYVKIQQKIVDLVKKMTPGLEGSVYDLEFSKKWEASCDEAQRTYMYKAAFKAYSVTQNTCAILWILSSLAGFIFDIGYLPAIMVTIIWLVSTVSYIVEGYHLEYKKGKE